MGVGHIKGGVALNAALNQSWEVLEIMMASLMATTRADALCKPSAPNVCVEVEIFISGEKSPLVFIKASKVLLQRRKMFKRAIEVGCADANVEGALSL